MAVNEIYHLKRGVVYIKNHKNWLKSTAYVTRRNPDGVKIKNLNDLGNLVDSNPRGTVRGIPIFKSEGTMSGNENAVVVDHYKYGSSGGGTVSGSDNPELVRVKTGTMNLSWITDDLK